MSQKSPATGRILTSRLACFITIACMNSLVCYSQCEQSYSWIKWSEFQNNRSSGTLWNGVKDIGVAVNSGYKVNSTPILYIISRFRNFTDFASLPRTTTPRVDWSGETVICFSEPVTNPVLVLASLGNPYTTVQISFSKPYVSLFADSGSELIDNYNIRGREGNAVLLFPGTVDCITVTSGDQEYFSDFTWGIRLPAFPVAVSEPIGGCGVSRITATGGIRYQWNGGKTPDAATNVFDRSGTYTVTATDNNGCTAYATATVSVPVQTTVRFEASPPLCDGQALTLSPSVTAATGSLRYKWTSGETTPSITATKPGVYEVSVQDGGCVKAASVTLTAAKPPDLLPDATVCLSAAGNALEAGSYQPGLTYSWLALGSNAQSVRVSQPGQYRVKVTNPAGCTAIRTINVLSPPSVDLGPTRGICPGVEMELKPVIDVPGNYTYRWSTGEQGPTIRVNQPDVYQVTVSNGICTASTSLALTARPLPEVLPDETRCREKTLSAGSLTPHVTYLWEQQGETTPSIAIQAEGVYRVRITNPEGCSVVRTIKVSGVCQPHVLVPTAFTPNGDGVNDVFKPFVVQGDVVELVVYNRWGEPIHSEVSEQSQWDGKDNGRDCPGGSYAYRLIYRTLQNSGNQTYYGTVSLLR